jgi:hypothetical protein
MLKKIPVSQLRVGMHLHALEGSWIDHPFWRARFLIDDPELLARVCACDVAEAWIDTRLGLDADPTPGAAAAAAAIATTAATAAPSIVAVPSPAAAGPRPLEAELEEAAAICNRPCARCSPRPASAARSTPRAACRW